MPAPNRPPERSTTYIVSGFFSSERVVSTTGFMNIETIMETATLSDIAPEVAATLNRGGLSAEPRASFSASQLGANQLLVRGAVLAHQPYKGGFGAWFVPYILTLGLFGLWGPSPMTFDDGYKFLYRVEVVDRDGRYVLTTGTVEGKIAHARRNLLVSGNERALFVEMRRRVAETLVEALSTGRQSAFGPQ